MSLRKSILIQKKEILGTDIKAYLNQDNFKVKKENKPRIFSNSVQLNKNERNLVKVYLLYVITELMINAPLGLFRPKEMLHDKKKRQFFTKMLLLRFMTYQFSIFPYLAHPDPSVERRSGF